MPADAADLIHARISRDGPLPFDVFMAEALYGVDGFFTRSSPRSQAGAAPGRDDFVTSPRVGSLFGRLVAGAVDLEWDRLGRPDPFVVIEGGAGDGSLARDILRAAPRCRAALRYVAVEGSRAARAVQRQWLAIEPPEHALGGFARTEAGDAPEPLPRRGPIVTQLADLPAGRFDGLILANELLDNLPFAIAERIAGGWVDVRVTSSPGAGSGAGPGGRAERGFAFVPGPPLGADPVPSAAVGVRVPVAVGAQRWLRRALATLRRGAALLVDYFATDDELVARSPDWLRTFAAQRRGGDPLTAPGRADITADVPLRAVARVAAGVGWVVDPAVTQADWLRGLGLDDLVAAARAQLAAQPSLREPTSRSAASLLHEAATLSAPDGLGAHRVLRLSPGARSAHVQPGARNACGSRAAH